MAPSPVRGIYRLPPEILLLIFSEFRWDGSEPFVPVGSDCPWSQYIRMRKTLLLVCRAWYNVVRPSLYSHVYLYRIDRLSALVRKLEEGSSGNDGGIAPHWVKHVLCEFFIPEGCELVYQKSIVALVKHCKNVRTFVDRPSWDDQIQYPLRSALLRLELDDPFPLLTELTVGEHVLAEKLRFRLSTFRQLSKLHLELDGDPNERASESNSGLLLPNLTTLICDFRSVDTCNKSIIIADHWALPKLQHLTVKLSWNSSANSSSMSLKPVEILCTAHGEGLLSLCLDNRKSYAPFAANLSHVLSLCPNLLRLT